MPNPSPIIYPNGLDSSSQLPQKIDGVTVIIASDINQGYNAIMAIEQELGVGPSGIFGTVVDRLNTIDTYQSHLTTQVEVTLAAIETDLFSTIGIVVGDGVKSLGTTAAFTGNTSLSL